VAPQRRTPSVLLVSFEVRIDREVERGRNEFDLVLRRRRLVSRAARADHVDRRLVTDPSRLTGE
jgi:hypothetical protein